MVNRGGSKVFSAEVETLLPSMPGPVDVAVFVAPDRLAGEAVAAFVVPATDVGVSKCASDGTIAGWQ